MTGVQTCALPILTKRVKELADKYGAAIEAEIGYVYHGRVQELAEAAREAGLKF